VLKSVEKRKRDDSPKYSQSGSAQQDPYGQSTLGRSTLKATPYPEDARPNPFLAREYDPLPIRMSQHSKVDAHSRGIGGMALHMRKHIVATASDDCTWKIFNLDTAENIMTGEGHREWISGVDFHPAGSHLVTCGADSALKLWDFINSGIAHTFQNISHGPLWKAKFHDTGDFVLTGANDGAIKLFDLQAVKLRQQYRSHTDSVNGLMW
jgi:WD40 repeat protein